MATRPPQGSYPQRPAPYGAQPPAAPARNNTTLLIAGGAALVLLILVGSVIMMFARGSRKTPAGNVPTNFFQQASADFAQAKQLLTDGKVGESMEKYAESQHFRSRAASEPTFPGGQTFGAWCAAKEKEYRAAVVEVAPALPPLVGKPGGPSIQEVNTLLADFSPPEVWAAWQRQVPGLERRAASAAAGGAHRIEWEITSDQADQAQDVSDDDRKPLVDALAARMGTTAPFVPASAAPGVAPTEGVGYVKCTLEFKEAPYVSQKSGKEFEVKVPAFLIATLEVTTNQAPGPYDGVHQFTAGVTPPKTLIQNDINTTRNRLQRDLIAKVVDQMNGKATAAAEPGTTRKPPLRRPGNDDPEALPSLRRPRQ